MKDVIVDVIKLFRFTKWKNGSQVVTPEVDDRKSRWNT